CCSKQHCAASAMWQAAPELTMEELQRRIKHQMRPSPPGAHQRLSTPARQAPRTTVMPSACFDRWSFSLEGQAVYQLPCSSTAFKCSVLCAQVSQGMSSDFGWLFLACSASQFLMALARSSGSLPLK